MTITADIVFDLQRRLQDLGRNITRIEQVDLVACEDGKSTMMYAYFDGGDDCTALCFERPPLFDPDELETAMLRGDAVGATLH